MTVGPEASTDIKTVELQAGLIVGLEAIGQGKISAEIGRTDAVVAQLLEHGDALLDLAKMHAVLKRKHRPRLVGGEEADGREKNKMKKYASHVQKSVPL